LDNYLIEKVKPGCNAFTKEHAFVHSIESLATLDGPGLRTVVFMQGCLMRCKFCHNIDSTPLGKGIKYSIDELYEKIISNKSYWGESKGGIVSGGVTFSGGEPTLQSEFIIDIAEKLKEEDVHITIDTNLFTSKEKLERLEKIIDYWMISIKELDNSKHKDLTGLGNKRIVENLFYLDNLMGEGTKRIRIRFVLMPEITTPEYIERLAKFLQPLKNLDVVEILPYTSIGKHKWIELFGKYEFEHVREPSRGEVEDAGRILAKYNLRYKY
jgi:pyruvate formate lyase activating enzyme